MYEKLLIPLDGSRAAESVLSFVDVLQSGVHVPMELVSAGRCLAPHDPAP
jgi:hypothetical protein